MDKKLKKVKISNDKKMNSLIKEDKKREKKMSKCDKMMKMDRKGK